MSLVIRITDEVTRLTNQKVNLAVLNTVGFDFVLLDLHSAFEYALSKSRRRERNGNMRQLKTSHNINLLERYNTPAYYDWCATLFFKRF